MYNGELADGGRSFGSPKLAGLGAKTLWNIIPELSGLSHRDLHSTQINLFISANQSQHAFVPHFQVRRTCGEHEPDAARPS